MSVTYKISGKGEKGGPFKKMLIFTTTIKVDGATPIGAKKQDLTVHFEGPPESGDIKPTIMGGDNAVYHIGFTPVEAGQYWVDFIFKGQIANEPFMLPVTGLGNKCPDVPYKGTARSGAAATSQPTADKKTDEADNKRKEEADKKKKEEEAEKQRKEEADKKKKEEEAEKKRKEEEADKKRKEEEAEKKRKDEEAEKKRKEEEADKKRKEEADKKKKEEEAEKKRKEEEADKKRKEEEAEKKRKEDEEKKKKEEADRKKKEEEDKKKKEEDDKKKKEEEDRKKKDEADRKKKEEEDKKKKEEADRKKKEEEDKKKKEEEDRKKKDEADKKKKEEEDKKKKEEADRKKREEELKKKDEERDRLEEERKAKLQRAQQRPADQKKQKVPATTPQKATVASMTIRFQAVNRNGEPKLEGGDSSQFKASLNGVAVTKIEDMGEGLYSFECETKPGKNTVDVQFNGKSVKGFPINFTRKTEAQLEQEKKELQRLAKEEEDKETKLALEAEEKPLPIKVETSVNVGSAPDTKKDDAHKAPSESELKLQELEERKRKIAEKRAELDRKRKELEPEKPAEPVSNARVATWEQKAKEEEKPKEKIEEKTPTSTTKGNFANRWLQEAQGKKEEKPEEKKVDLQGAGATKLASVWQSRLEGKDPETPKVEKTVVDLPEGTGASKLASQWKNKLETPQDDPKANIDRSGSKRGPSKIASMWEQKANEPEQNQPKAKSDIEELKAMMAKERDQATKGSSGSSVNTFTGDSVELEILLNFLNDTLKDEKNAKGVPMSADNATKTFQDLSDGINLCYFLDKKMPNLMDARVITRRVNDKRDKIDNWNLCVNTAKAAGCRLSDVKVDALADGDGVQIQKVLWEIIRVGQESDIKILDDYWQTILPDLSSDDISKMPADKLILAWVNKILKKRGHNRTANSITSDFKDGWILIELCDDVLSVGTDLHDETDPLMKAEGVLLAAEDIGSAPYATAEGLVEGVYWQTYILLTTLILSAT